MATYIDKENHTVISQDDVRGGVTGHNVRYVLEYGMAGIIIAFVAFAIYAGYDHLYEKLSAAFSQGLSGIIRASTPYAVIVLLGAIGGVVLLRLWTLLSGPTDDGSQRFMRTRVVAQFAIISVIVAMSYFSML
jgi:Hypoxia induced protein conserved region